MKHIVVVEDDEPSAQYMYICIKNAGYVPIVFELGYNGISYVKDNYKDISLIFMDINLPDISGLDAVKIIKKEYPTLPIIVLTAYYNHREEALLSGCDMFITKPIPSKKITQLINKYVEYTT